MELSGLPARKEASGFLGSIEAACKSDHETQHQSMHTVNNNNNIKFYLTVCIVFPLHTQRNRVQHPIG